MFEPLKVHRLLLPSEHTHAPLARLAIVPVPVVAHTAEQLLQYTREPSCADSAESCA
jgi:hypothetical protein